MFKKISTCLLFCLFLYLPGKISAEEVDSNSLPFMMKPILTDIPQKQGVTGYYHVLTEPNKKITLKLLLQNKVDRKIELELSSLNGLTSPTGGIQYLNKAKTQDAWLLDSKYELLSNIKIPKTVTLLPKESKEISFEVTSPDVQKGVMVGGISIKEKKKEQVNQPNTTFSIQNEYAFILGVVLDYGDTKNNAFELGDVFFQKQNVNPKLLFQMSNKGEGILEEITGTYTVLDKNRKKLKEFRFGPFNMAPKSQINYQTIIDPLMFPAGEYILQINTDVMSKRNNENKKETYQKEATFTISEKKQNETILSNNDNISHVQKPKDIEQPFYKQSIFWIMFSIIVFLIILLFAKRNKKSENKDS